MWKFSSIFEDILDDYSFIGLGCAFESEKDLEFKFNLAGYGKEEVGVKGENSYLVVYSKRKDDKWSKRLYVSHYHDLSKTSAKMKNGLLKVKIPLKAGKNANDIKIE
jgi:HSP20 family molecular chaperone IbpA